MSGDLKTLWSSLSQDRYPWEANIHFYNFREDEVHAYIPKLEDPITLMSIKAENGELSKYIEDLSRFKEIPGTAFECAFDQIFRSLNSYIISNYVPLLFYQWPTNELMEWEQVDYETIRLKSPPLKVYSINNMDPFSEGKITMNALFALIIFAGISNVASLDHSESYLKINEPSKHISEKSNIWKRNVESFLHASLKCKTLTGGGDRNADEVASRTRGRIEYDIQAKRRKQNTVECSTDKFQSISQSHRETLYLIDLSEESILPRASNYTSVKFVLEYKQFEGNVLNISDDDTRNQLLSKLSEDAVKEKINRTKRIFLKIYDYGDLERLKYYNRDIRTPKNDPGLSVADRHRVRQMNKVYVEDKEECLELEHQNELRSINLIQKHNLAATRQTRVNTPELFGHGKVLINTLEGRYYQAYFLAFEYIESTDKKPSSQKEINSLDNQIRTLHSLDIHHGDLEKRNVYVHDGIVSVFNFGNCFSVSEQDYYDHSTCLDRYCSDYDILKQLTKELKEKKKAEKRKKLDPTI